MRILGIDPGYDRLGLAVIEKNGGKETLIHSECFQTSSKDSVFDRLRSIGEKVSSIIAEFEPDAMALESLFITKNQKTAMRVSEARGIIIYEGVKAGLELAEYSPMQIKTSITGDGTSDKSRMIKMVNMLIGAQKGSTKVTLTDKKRHDDEYDAIAVGLTHAAISRGK